ncbi:translocation/assembly module TamB domain-containing protein [Nonomuraea gerenzanensis]|uniref:Membrane-associated oxidoreductase n=1 Tax=Nonomuraea gerenzanensis TaxID=93944 RepID=A0A1M4EAT2_9ACTN|nr:hypothetical protein [Nonomuraea gerenzanensis]UBU17908.1 hypothetical protein LCN96_23650 [Nonomuraea gerenzanensis]SBO95703.1 membrane-associated oxidoreductase [Nonomuraea gerenzanensis]
MGIEADLGELRGAERALLTAFVHGTWLDLRAGDAEEDDPAGGESWGPARTVRAEVIRALLLGAAEAEPGWAPAIRLRGARVVGRLDLMGATVEHPLSCEHCFFDSGLRLVEATTKTVRIVGSRLPGFNGARLRLDGILNFWRSVVSGGIRLDRARVLGDVSLRAAVVGPHPSGVAVAADGLNVDGSLELDQGLRADGPVVLRGCRVTGSLTLEDASLHGLPGSGVPDAASDSYALNADNAVIEGRLIADRMRADGGIRLMNARVGASLRLNGARLDSRDGAALSGGGLAVSGGVFCMDGFAATGELRLVGARLDANLCLTGAALRNQHGACLTLDRAAIGSLDASGVTVAAGAISLAGTTVGGGFLLDGAHLDNGRDPCLLVESSVFEGPLRLRHVRARGEVRIRNSRTSGRVLLNGATLDNPGAAALRFTRNEVGSDVVCDGMTAHGEVRFVDTQIALDLDLEGALLSNPGGTALDARGLQAAELALLPDGDVEGAVVLEHVRVGLLRDDPARRPRTLRVNGLTYTVLEPRCSARERVRWLSGEDFHPQPYEQLAASYAAVGQHDAARAVLYAKERRQQRDRLLLGRVWSVLQDVTVGFGYKPWRAATWLAVLLAIGGAVYSASPPPPLKPGESPHYIPVVYALDLLLPIVDLGQQSAFNPAGVTQWLSYGLIVAGWILATTVVAGAARVLGR